MNYTEIPEIKKDEAIAMYRTKSNLARALGVSRQAIDRWSDIIPERHALKIRYVLKPELWEEK